MLGGIIGDVVGSALEKKDEKNYEFPLFTEKNKFTDDTVCALAIAETLVYQGVWNTLELTSNSVQIALRHWSRRYPDAGYGKFYKVWLASDNPKPYGSIGNGSAMRVGPVGFAATSLAQAEELARTTALPTHGSKEGIVGAQAVAVAIFLARQNRSKEDIKQYIEAKYGYDLSTPVDTFRPLYKFDGTCSGSVPQAIRCFLESTDFESAIRLACSLGGDTDTQACIAGNIAQAWYRQIPEYMMVETLQRLPDSFVDMVFKFSDKFAVSLY